MAVVLVPVGAVYPACTGCHGRELRWSGGGGGASSGAGGGGIGSVGTGMASVAGGAWSLAPTDMSSSVAAVEVNIGGLPARDGGAPTSKGEVSPTSVGAPTVPVSSAIDSVRLVRGEEMGSP
jgi:hypothetical protein